MKVLFLAPYLTIEDDHQFMRNVTGFGYMVRDIADHVSRTGAYVDVITNSALTKGKKYNDFNVLKRTWPDLLFNIKLCYLKKAIQLIKTYKPSLKRKWRVFIYYLFMGYVEYILKHGNYDIVHIHGLGFGTKPYMDCCEMMGIQYLVTLHGLNAFSDGILMENGEKQFEKDFLEDAFQRRIVLTVISTGILKIIKDYLGVQDINNFHIVLNGTDVAEKTCRLTDIRQKYGISRNNKVMLCIGNLCKTKNQLQVIRAYAYLPPEIKSQLTILFLGKDATNGEFEGNIRKLGFSNNLFLCGYISRKEIASYFKQANYTILASISEGFGLSMIEGFVYGLPNLTFADLAAIKDVYDEKAMIIVNDRKDETLADGMRRMLSREWDHEAIKQYAQKFSLEIMAHNYHDVYSAVLQRRSNDK